MPDMKITINLDQEVYDAIAAALPKYRVETTDPDNPNRSTIAPRWDSPEAWIEYVIETQAAPFLADRPKSAEVKQLEEQRKVLDSQIKAAMSARVKVGK
jgi:hypothetical protein